MLTDARLLKVVQWLSPAYPVGAFAYSHGLEWAVEAGQVADAGRAQDWIADVLRHGAGWSDAVLLAAAHAAPDDDAVADIDATARAFAPTAERRLETGAQGAAFAAATRGVWPDAPLADLTYPVAVGRAAALHGLPLVPVAQLYLQAMASALVAAAIRLVPLGQTEGQRILDALGPACLDVAVEAVRADLDDLSGATFLGDIASMRHETQYSRIFRT